MRPRVLPFLVSAGLVMFTAPASSVRSVMHRSSVTVDVDARIELFSIVQFLAGRMDNQIESPYRAAVEAWFGQYRAHEAVTRMAALVEGTGSWGIPATLGVALSPPPELRPIEPFPTQVSAKPVSEDSLRAYVEAVRDFARVTDYAGFRRSQMAFYDTLATATRNLVALDSLVAVVEEYWGGSQASYQIHLSPLMPAGGVGPRREAPGGGDDVHAILGARRGAAGTVAFGTAGSLRQLVLHEFSHAFVNPVVDEMGAATDRRAILFWPLRHRLRQADGLTSWRQATQEFLIRGFTARQATIARGDSVGRSLRGFDRQLGFEYIDEFTTALEGYESRRDLYPTLGSYYPMVLEMMDDLARSGLDEGRFARPFEGNVAMARWHDENLFWAIIVPTAEANPALQDSLHAMVRTLRDRFYPSSFIITDRDALAQDLSRFAIYAWGTPEGNLWLRAHRDALPIDVRPDRVVADSSYPGTKLVVVMAAPNPDNPAKPMVVATGQRIEEVSRAFWSWAADYAVMRGGDRVAIGDFPVKEPGNWGFTAR